MIKKQFLITILIAAAVSLVVRFVFPENPASKNAGQETVFARVMQSGTIRCGYGLAEPFLMKNPNTGEITGVYKDYMDALGKALSLKVDWVEESGWGNMPAALAADRFDLFCAPVGATAGRARTIDFTAPFAFSVFKLYARQNDQRFDRNPAAIDRADISMIAQEGGLEEKLVPLHFAHVKKLTLPQNQDYILQFEDVASGKVDIALAEAATAEKYIQKNPGKIKEVAGIAPMGLYGIAMAIKQGQDEFKAMINIASTELVQNGGMGIILDKYQVDPKIVLRVTAPADVKVLSFTGPT